MFKEGDRVRFTEAFATGAATDREDKWLRERYVGKESVVIKNGTNQGWPYPILVKDPNGGSPYPCKPEEVELIDGWE